MGAGLKHSRRSGLLAAATALVGASGCLLTTSLGELTAGDGGGDAGRADAAVDVITEVAPRLDGGPEDPCSESTLIICFPFETSTAGIPAAGTVATSVDLVSGGRGRAARFSSAAGSRIVIPSSAAWEVAAFTIEAWVSPRRVPATDERFGLVDSEFRGSMFLYPDGRVHCRAGTNGGNVEALSAPIQVDRFSHVACVFDVDSVAAYANGELSERRQLARVVGTGQPTFIGANAPNGGDHFDGLLDDVRVHRVPLDGAVIRGRIHRD
ncbi:MAG: LamG domain-containing protein [Deltaproteobacteria bacterium]|nr:LamG domain-containing protein [Deltaproteobacteria bacterium]